MSDMGSGDAVHRRIAELARDLHGEVTRDDSQLAAALVKVAVAEIPGADYASLTIAHDRKRVESFAYTDAIAAEHDRIQADVQEGPCISAALGDRIVRVDDLEHDDRWPAYRDRVLAETPTRASLSFQLFTSQGSIGALNLFSDTPNAFDLEAEDIGVVLATHAALAWETVRKDQQFHSALASRDTIGQAKGILMERFDIDAVAAFDLMKRLSQESNTKIAEIARQITEKR